MELRARSVAEIDDLVKACLIQVDEARARDWFIDKSDRKQIKARKERMRALIKECGLTKAVPNPCVGRVSHKHDPKRVIAVVCEITGYSKAEMLGERRFAALSRARHMLFYAIKQNCRQLSSPMIGRLCNRDHTAILHGVKKADELLATEPDHAELYQRILARLAWEQ